MGSYYISLALPLVPTDNTHSLRETDPLQYQHTLLLGWKGHYLWGCRCDAVHFTFLLFYIHGNYIALQLIQTNFSLRMNMSVALSCTCTAWATSALASGLAGAGAN